MPKVAAHVTQCWRQPILIPDDNLRVVFLGTGGIGDRRRFPPPGGYGFERLKGERDVTLVIVPDLPDYWGQDRRYRRNGAVFEELDNTDLLLGFEEYLLGTVVEARPQVVIAGQRLNTENVVRRVFASHGDVLTVRYSVFYGRPSTYTNASAAESGYMLDIPKDWKVVERFLGAPSVLSAIEERDRDGLGRAIHNLNGSFADPILVTPLLENLWRPVTGLEPELVTSASAALASTDDPMGKTVMSTGTIELFGRRFDLGWHSQPIEGHVYVLPDDIPSGRHSLADYDLAIPTDHVIVGDIVSNDLGLFIEFPRPLGIIAARGFGMHNVTRMVQAGIPFMRGVSGINRYARTGDYVQGFVGYSGEIYMEGVQLRAGRGHGGDS